MNLMEVSKRGTEEKKQVGITQINQYADLRRALRTFTPLIRHMKLF
jgi:hypothetical protein